MAQDIATLRALSADEVLARLPNHKPETLGLSYVPLVDGYVVPDDPTVLVGTNSQLKVPLLIGHNADEGLFCASDLPKTLSDIAISSARGFPQNSLTQCSRGIRQRQTPRSRWRRRCWTASHESSRPRYSRLARLRKSATSTCIGFRVSRRPAGQPGGRRAHHRSRVRLRQHHWGRVTVRRDDRTVSRAMADAWVQFAKAGNPNGVGLPQWPAYRSPDYRLLDFGDRVTVRSNARSPQVDFFQRAFETMRGKWSRPTAPLK